MAVVYGREYGDKILSFEASGALMEATLVMRDRETDSWWSIVTGDAVGGAMEGAKLDELPVGEKVRWHEWRQRYPKTLVLSVDGREHDPDNPYAGYLRSDRTFQRLEAKDTRLPAKEPVFTFRVEGQQYAVPHSAIEGGGTVVIAGRQLFLHRGAGAEVFESTRAYVVKEGAGRIEHKGRTWVETVSGLQFKENAGFPAKAREVEKLAGFDTFWYTLTNIVSGSLLLEVDGEGLLKIRTD